MATIPATFNLGAPEDWSLNYQLPEGIEAPIASPRPSQQTGFGATLPAITGGILGGTATDSTAGQPGPTAWQKIGQMIDQMAIGGAQITGVAGSGALSPTSAASDAGSWLTQGVFIILGLILIGAGLMMFKQTQVVIQRGAELGGRVAAAAA
jgi:hypothetical protein